MKFLRNFLVVCLCVALFSTPVLAGWFSAFGIDIGVEVDEEILGTLTVAGLWPSMEYYKRFPNDPLMGGPFCRLDQSFPKGWIIKMKISCEVDPCKVYGYECYVSTLNGQLLKIGNEMERGIDVNSLEDEQRAMIMAQGGVFLLDSNQITGTGPLNVIFLVRHHASKNRYYIVVFTLETDKDGTKVNAYNITMFSGDSGLIMFPLGFQFVNGPCKGFKTGDFLIGEESWTATQESVLNWINGQVSGETQQQIQQQVGKITVFSSEKSDYLILIDGKKCRSVCHNQSGQVFYDQPFERPDSPKLEIGSEIVFQKIIISTDGKSFERIGQPVKIKFDGKAVEVKI